MTDGDQTRHVRDYYDSNDITFDLPCFDNFGDQYRVVVWAQEYKQAGFTRVLLSDQYVKILDIMLIPGDPGSSFVGKSIEAPPMAGTPVSRRLADFFQCGWIQVDDLSQARRILLRLT